MDIAPSKFPNATTRIAFVGYRDHCDGDLRQVKYDFVEVSEVENLKNQVETESFSLSPTTLTPSFADLVFARHWWWGCS